MAVSISGFSPLPCAAIRTVELLGEYPQPAPGHPIAPCSSETFPPQQRILFALHRSLPQSMAQKYWTLSRPKDCCEPVQVEQTLEYVAFWSARVAF